MALSDEIKSMYDQVDAMIFAADSLQKCLADPSCYAPYHGSDARENILKMQMSLNTSIKSLREKMNEMHRSMDEVKTSYSSSASKGKNQIKE